MGIEPTPSAWKAEVLPLNYTRPSKPPRTPKASSTQSASFAPTLPGSSLSHGGGGRIRTFEGVSRQIYSLLPLTAWVPHREKRAAYSDFRFSRCQFEMARDLLAQRPSSRPDTFTCGAFVYTGALGLRWMPFMRSTGISFHWPDRRSGGSSTGP